MTFTYKVRTTKGNILQGTLEANDQRAAVERLRAQKYIVLEITEAQKNALTEMLNSINPFKPKAKAKDIVIFSRQLSVMINAGVPIVQAMSIIEEQIENPYFKKVVGSIREDIEGGTSIADALAKYPDCFDSLYINMARAGELGGILDVILQRLSAYLEAADQLKGKIKGAMVYNRFRCDALSYGVCHSRFQDDIFIVRQKSASPNRHFDFGQRFSESEFFVYNRRHNCRRGRRAKIL